MSEALTDAAPSGEDVTAAVAESDVLPSGEVDEGSAQVEDDPFKGYVPVARFNGLMGALAKKDNALAEANQRIQELSTELSALNSSQPAEQTKETTQVDTTDPNVQALLEEVRALRAGFAEQQLAVARAAVLEEFPTVAPLQKYLIADSPEALRSLAAELSEALGSTANAVGASDEVTSAGEQPAAETTGRIDPPIVTTGGQFSKEAAVTDRKVTAIKERSFTGLLGALLDEAETQS